MELSPDPQMVRRSTIEKMEVHRDRFRELLDEICAEAGSDTTGREIWDRNSYSKFHRWQSVPSLMEEIEDDNGCRA